MIDLLAWCLVAPILPLLAYLVLELSLGLIRLPARVLPSSPSLRIAILVPAHDEGKGIGETVRTAAASVPGARILVVADNCSDDTALRARAAGADVIERCDPLHRGKGFALAFGRDHLRGDPPDAVVILDADCRIAVGSAEALAAAAVAEERPVQGRNLVVSPRGASPLVSISNFAMLVKNLVRARGLFRIGGGALLFGTGMAFPWPLFARLPLASDNLVEDLELGVELATRGVTIGFDDRSLVTSPAASLAGSLGQRSRWEHGFLAAAARHAGPLLRAGARRRSRHLLALAAHLLVPPLALLLLVGAAAFMLAAMAAFYGATALPALLLGAMLLLVSLLLLIAWQREARAILPLRDLARAPFYLLWKIPLYLAFFTRREADWRRTDRG